jgi:hypothetical protein
LRWGFFLPAGRWSFPPLPENFIMSLHIITFAVLLSTHGKWAFFLSLLF